MTDAIGILGFTLHAIHKVHDLVQVMKGAPDEIKSLEKEASRVEVMLPQLRDMDAMQNRGRGLARHNQSLDLLYEDAKELKDETDVFVNKVTKKGVNTLETKIMWVRYAGDGKKLADKFRSFYISLCAGYSVATL